LFYVLGGRTLKQLLPDVPAWVFALMALGSAFGLVCAIALFRWKKWGFWGCCASNLLVFILNLSSGIGIGKSIYGLAGLGILYILLQTGKENRAWPQLE